MKFDGNYNVKPLTSESCIVMSDWWSGIIRQCPKNRQGYLLSLQWKDASGAVHHRHFFSAESAEQFMDELDLSWGTPDGEFSFYSY